jgi:hypothetical protein
VNALTVSEAKPQLGRLVDQALRSKPVFIRRGNQFVQLVPAAASEPIPVLPPGALGRRPEDIAFLTATAAADESKPYSR